jgi:protein SCO1/2
MSAPVRRSALPAVLAGVALALAATGWLLLRQQQRTEVTAPLPVLGQLPGFRLVDQAGTAVSASDLRGRVTVVNFIFTRCPTVCPVFTMKMRRVQDRTADLGDRLALVSFSVDPAHDTPARLAAFASKHGADPRRWRFLTGPEQEVRAAVERGLKIAMERRGNLPGGVPDIVHGGHFVLLDADLAVRGYYDGSDGERIEALLRDARRLASRPPGRRPGA